MIHALIIFLEIWIIIDLVVLYDDVFGLHIFYRQMHEKTN